MARKSKGFQMAMRPGKRRNLLTKPEQTDARRSYWVTPIVSLGGSPQFPLGIMLRIHLLQQSFALSAP